MRGNDEWGSIQYDSDRLEPLGSFPFYVLLLLPLGLCPFPTLSLGTVSILVSFSESEWRTPKTNFPADVGSEPRGHKQAITKERK